MPKELELLNEWQERLGLNDWFIVLQTKCKPENMVLEDADGYIEYTETTKAARISIIDEKLRDKKAIRPFNFEETLVHELLHLKFSLLEQGEDWDHDLQLRMLHQIIDDLSRILVALKYYEVKHEE